MADVQVHPLGDVTAPAAARIPGSAEWLIKACFASFDGTGASGSFQPCLRIISDAGTVVAESAAATVAAGASADVSWFPGEQVEAAAAGGGIQFDTDPQAGDWLVVTTTGNEPGPGIGMQFTDTGEGGINFATDGFGTNGGGVYVAATATSVGQMVTLQVEGENDGTGEIRGIQVDAFGPNALGFSQPIGIVSNAEGTSSAGAEGLSAGGIVVTNNGGTAEAIGVVAGGTNASSAAAGATGVRTNAQNATAGHAIGIDSLAVGNNGQTGDVIGGRFTAENAVGGTGVLYGLQVFIGTTKVFQINANGSLHGLTGQALTFDL